jgi:hypothetical protein
LGQGRRRGSSPRISSPLAELPLKRLTIRPCVRVDLAPLQGKRLVELDVMASGVTDLRVVKGMPLWRLNAHGSRVEDLRPLAHCPKLGDFYCPGTAESLAPLAGLRSLKKDITVKFDPTFTGKKPGRSRSTLLFSQ